MSYAMNSRRSGGWSSSSNQPPPVIEPRRFGLKYEPPSIVLEYTRQGRLRLYEVHLKPSDLEKDAETIAQRLVKKHGAYFDPAKVDMSQLESLIRSLKERRSEPPSSRTADKLAPTLRAATAFGDLNKVSEEALQDAKDKMSVLFDQNFVDRTDPSYQWDKRADFVPQEPSDWDDEDDF